MHEVNICYTHFMPTGPYVILQNDVDRVLKHNHERISFEKINIIVIMD